MEAHLPLGASKKKLIVAAHVAADADRFNCKACPWGRHCDEKNPAPFEKFVIEIDGQPFLKSRTCFLPMITPASHGFLRLHTHYRKQLLPRAGGISDQANLYIEAIEVLEHSFNRIEIERARERARGQV